MRNIFECEGCSRQVPVRYLSRRDTMPGEYCPDCAAKEKCAACGELHHRDGFMNWMDNVYNYICDNCKYDYVEVARYIKPLGVLSAEL